MEPTHQQYNEADIDIFVTKDPHHFDQLQDLFKKEGWSENRDDFDVWQNSVPNFQWIVAYSKAEKKVIGSVTVLEQRYRRPHPGRQFFTGYFMVASEHRGTGLGRKLFAEAAKITHGSNWGLYSVPVMSNWYATRHGMDEIADYKTLEASIPISELTSKDFADVDVEKVVKFDATITDFDRTAYLLKFFSAAHIDTKVALNADGDVVGVASIRDQCSYQTIGPWYAISGEVAKALLCVLLSKALKPDLYGEQRKLLVYVPDKNVESLRILESLVGHEVTTKVHGTLQYNQELPPPMPYDRVFGVIEGGHSVA